MTPAQTDEEFRNQYLSSVDSTTIPRSPIVNTMVKNVSRQNMDWRTKGFVSEVCTHETGNHQVDLSMKFVSIVALLFVCYCMQVGHQGYMCKSSWAFSAAGALEGLNHKLRGQLVTLSAQQLVDCSEPYGNKGCEGGTVQNAFRYVHEEGGVCTGSAYPYIGYVSSFIYGHATFI